MASKTIVREEAGGSRNKDVETELRGRTKLDKIRYEDFREKAEGDETLKKGAGGETEMVWACDDNSSYNAVVVWACDDNSSYNAAGVWACDDNGRTKNLNRRVSEMEEERVRGRPKRHRSDCVTEDMKKKNLEGTDARDK